MKGLTPFRSNNITGAQAAADAAPADSQEAARQLAELLASAWHPDLFAGLALAGANRPARAAAEEDATADDGLLTAAEVAASDLRGTQLVVLSACDTGLGRMSPGEGFFGLQRSFHVAGARSVVASLWQVDDAATRALMVESYRNLW
ncbi:MAG: CHAT domain-containing protein [Pirellulales bacterium]